METRLEQSPDESLFQALEIERMQALVARDVPSIGRLHAADHELINVPGSVFSLEGYVSLMAVDVFCADWEHGPMKVHV